MKTSKTFKILIWQCKAKAKEELAPIYARITINGQRAEISTGENYPINDWDSKISRAIGRTAEARAFNQELDYIKACIENSYKELVKEGRHINAQAVKARYLGTDNHGTTLLDLVKYHEDKMQCILEPGTMKNYYTTEKYLKAFLSKKLKINDIYLEQLGYSFIVSFEQYIRNPKNALSKKSISNNGVMKHIERTNKLMNLAVKLEWISKNPFGKYQLKFTKYDRAYLSASELNTLETIIIKRHNLSVSRDMFVFACYTGLSYIDVKLLTRDNIVFGIDGKQWLSLRREKSEQPVKVPLLAKALAILEKYKEYDVTNKLLPVYSNQKINAYIREVVKRCKIDKHISFHVARHTFATTVTLSNGVPIETVSKLLGHSKLSTTQIYARVLEDKMSNDISMLEQKLGALKRNAI